MSEPAPNYSSPDAWMQARTGNAEAAILAAVKDVAGTARMQRALLSYQQRAVLLIETGCNVLIIEKSRRIGMTWGLAAEAVLRAARMKAEGGCDFLYISYSQEMTREFIDACSMWAKLFEVAASATDEFLFKDEKTGEETRSIQAFRIAFASGFEIVGLSSAPRALRGRQGVVMIDEAAFVDSLEELIKSAMAMLMWGGQVIICSTHNGTDNYFNQIIQQIHSGEKDYKHMRVDIDDALRDGLYQRICLVGKKPWSPETQQKWRNALVKDYGDAAQEELFCVPSQGSGTWLSTALIERQMTESPDKIVRWVWDKDYLTWGPQQQKQYLAGRLGELNTHLATLDPQHRHALGFDFARVANGDLSVVDVVTIDHVLMRGTGLVLEMRGVPYEEQHQIVHYIWNKLPNPKGAAFDATGAGGYVAEAMSRRHGLYDQKLEEGGMVAEIKFSVEWYRLHMPKVKAAFEEGNIAIPKDALLSSDLRAVKLVQGVAQVPAVRTGTTGLKRHGDYAIAKALSWYASLMNTVEFGYESMGGATASQRDSFNTPPGEDDFGSADDWREPLGAELRGTL
jgi:phage FluMu gp28-like protein